MSRFVILFVLSLLTIACDSTETVATYYSPVFSSNGNEIAYVKRISRFTSETKGLGLQDKLTFREDQLMVCKNNLNQKDERCVELWDLPLKKVNEFSKGSIKVILGWEDKDLKFRIRLIRFNFDVWEIGVPGKDYGSGPERVIANVERDEEIKYGFTTHDSLMIKVDLNPEKYAFPVNNKIVIISVQIP